ncbi:MAG: hypothetical protein RBT65_14720 [Methanolobus sp.]|nr:hypothetical protein [Methanolobus sp.]
MLELTDVSRLVPKDSLTIDGEKLAGIEDFTIDARRCKAEIRLLNTNQSQNQDIIDSLTDKTRLLKDSMETENVSAILFSNEKAHEAFSRERLFAIDKWSGNHTWDYGDGTIAVQSIVLRNIFYNTLKRDMVSGSNGNGNDFFNNLTAMLVAAMLNHYSVPITTPIGIGHVYQYISDRMGYGWSEVTEISNAVLPFLQYHVYDRDTAYMKIDDLYSVLSLHFGTGNLIENVVYTNENSGTTTTDSGSQYADNTNTNIDSKAWMIADFFASLFSIDDYSSLVTSYQLNRMTGQKLSRQTVMWNVNSYTVSGNRNSYYTPFYLNKQVVMGGSVFTEEILYSNISTFMKASNSILIKTCSHHQESGLQIGRTQTKTMSSETDGQIPVLTENEEYIEEYWNNFIPVERTYYIDPIYYFNPGFDNDVFSLYLDNISISELLSSPDSFLFTTGFTETNWMYFDSIKCKERILTPDEDTFVDNISVFDLEDESQVDNYGLYIYRDYFQKYYTKSASNVTDILVQLKDVSTNKVLFTGLIDFNTVERTKKAITFEAIDAIGLLADNARKLNGIVHFSQFDTGGDGTIAEKKAGTTLKQFTETLIKTPFPYEHSLASSLFDIGNNSGLENKLLDTIETDKAIVMAIQCAKKLLYVDGTGKIQLGSVLWDNTATIDGQIIEESISQNTDIDELEFDQLKKVAGYDKFLPSIVSFYKSINYNYKERIDMQIYGQTSEIKLLDKIIYKSKVYFVMEKNINLSNGILNITLIGGI